ncbi:MAG TPA: hypothetical protein VHT04_16145 [Stellaceae bacterium]|nr:hypothetical protein [Stellaceae bacterium]
MSKKPKNQPAGKTAIPAWIKPRGSAPAGGGATSRIDIEDTPSKAVFKLVEGDRAAAEACIAMVKAVAQADPDAEFGPFTPLLILESIGLTGKAIGEVYVHVCGDDPVCALAVLHAARLKLVTVEKLKSAAAGRTPINTDVLLDAIRSKMPRFGR